MVRIIHREVTATLIVVTACAAAGIAQQEAPVNARPRPARQVVEKPTCIGADPIGTTFFVRANKEGRREEFGPIAKEVAFEIWLDGETPDKSTVAASDPEHPGAAAPVEQWKVPVCPITTDEFMAYCDYIRGFAQVGDESTFISAVLVDLMEQRAVHLYYRDALPKVRERVAMVIERLERGVPFENVVKQNTEDDTGRQAGGLFGDDVHGAFLGQYPMEIVAFGMKPGELVGPIYNKYAAYVLRCDEFVPNPTDHRRDRVKLRAICIRYAQNSVLSGKERDKLMSSIRLRSDQERFRRMMPPALQVPPVTRFGPDDIAPIGHPAEPLKQRSLDDARDNQPKSGH